MRIPQHSQSIQLELQNMQLKVDSSMQEKKA
jgi:hypothetical protein